MSSYTHESHAFSYYVKEPIDGDRSGQKNKHSKDYFGLAYLNLICFGIR